MTWVWSLLPTSGLVFQVQFLSKLGHLAAFEAGGLDRPPTVGGAEHRLGHQLFARGVGDDLEVPVFLDEKALEQVGGLDCPNDAY